jgi:hypothetical protein
VRLGGGKLLLAGPDLHCLPHVEGLAQGMGGVIGNGDLLLKKQAAPKGVATLARLRKNHAQRQLLLRRQVVKIFRADFRGDVDANILKCQGRKVGGAHAEIGNLPRKHLRWALQ